MAPSEPPREFALTDDVFTALFEARDEPLEIVDILSLPPGEIEAFREAHPDLTESEAQALLLLYGAASREHEDDGPHGGTVHEPMGFDDWVASLREPGDVALHDTPPQEPREKPEQPEPHASPPLRGQHIGKYVILDELGRGAAARVYKAYDPELDRKVAVKLYSFGAGDARNARVVRAGRALARLSHPNVVSVFEIGTFEGHVFIVHELADGRTLREWQSKPPLPTWRECVPAYLEAGRGLAAMHSAGLVYRDFKPDNCIIDARGRVRIVGLHLLKPLHASNEPRGANAAPDADADLDAGLTLEGTVIGTPAYMSPEQFNAEAADERSDQFNFCVALYEAVYGERPFEGRTIMKMRENLMRGARRAPPRASVPAKLHRALLRGLKPDPTRRWPSMNALLTELERVASPPVSPWLVVVMTAAGAVTGVGVAASVQSGSAGYQCRDTPARLDEIWNEQRKDAVRSAVLETARPDAQELWVQMEWGLDSYARAWAARYEHACEAEEETKGDRALRIACLDNRRADFEAAVGALELANEAPPDVMSGLTPLSVCDDVDALRKKL